MNFGFRQGNVGIRVGPLGAIVIGILYLIALPVILTIKLIVAVTNHKAAQDRKRKVQAAIEANLMGYRDKTLAEAAPGWQRDQLQYWFDIAIPAFTAIKTGGATPHLVQEYQSAIRSIDSLRSLKVLDCSNCGAVTQVAGRPCGYCAKVVTAG